MILLAPIQQSSAAAIVIHTICAMLSLYCGMRAARVANTKSHYKSLFLVRYFFPYCAFVLVIENIVLACSRLLKNSGNAGNVILSIVNVLLATVDPILLIVTFELCYLVHKRRSVNFCGMIFDRGQRVRIFPSSWIRSFLLRNFMRILATLLFVLSLCVQFNVISPDNEETGRAGWIQWFQSVLPFDEKKQWFLSLLPTGVLCLCNFYMSIIIWRYGSSSSMVVHSSCFNPWFSLFFGTLALSAGELFSINTYLITSNIGVIIFFCSIILLLKEVDKEMAVADDFDDFLRQVEIMGVKTSTKHIVANSSTQQEQHNNNSPSLDYKNMPNSPLGGANDRKISIRSSV